MHSERLSGVGLLGWCALLWIITTILRKFPKDSRIFNKMPLSIFDIAGPVMVGPSSSHTAGACKIGQMARALFDTTPDKTIFHLHGSFAEVYKGHATDRALLAGTMKYKTSSSKIKHAFEVAKRKGIKYSFHTKDLGADLHPNSVEIIMNKKGRKPMSVIGSSLGAGMIEIVKIDDFDVRLREVAGKYKTLVVSHSTPAAVGRVVRLLEKKEIEVVDKRSVKFDDHFLTIIDTEGRKLHVYEVVEFEELSGVLFVRSLTKLPD
jgi:L-serine dehydratase